MTGFELIVMISKYFLCFGLFIWGYIEGRKDKQREIDRENAEQMREQLLYVYGKRKGKVVEGDEEDDVD